MARLHDLGASVSAEHVVEVGPRIGRHGDPHAPAFGEPALCRGMRGTLAGAVGVVIGQDDDGCRERQRRQDQRRRCRWSMSAAHTGKPVAVITAAPVSIPSDTISMLAGRREADGAAFDRAERQARFAERSLRRPVRLRAMSDELPTGPCSTCSTSAIIAGRLPPSGCRSQDCDARIVGGIASSTKPRAAQYRSTASHERRSFVPPEIQRVGDPPLPVAFFGRAPPLYFRRVRWICRAPALALEQPEPAQLGQHVIPRATGMAMHDQSVRTVVQRQCRAAGLMHRAAAAVPCAGAAAPRRARRQFRPRTWLPPARRLSVAERSIASAPLEPVRGWRIAGVRG